MEVYKLVDSFSEGNSPREASALRDLETYNALYFVWSETKRLSKDASQNENAVADTLSLLQGELTKLERSFAENGFTLIQVEEDTFSLAGIPEDATPEQRKRVAEVAREEWQRIKKEKKL